MEKLLNKLGYVKISKIEDLLNVCRKNHTCENPSEYTKVEARHERTSFNLEKDGKCYWIDIAIFEEKKEDE